MTIASHPNRTLRTVFTALVFSAIACRPLLLPAQTAAYRSASITSAALTPGEVRATRAFDGAKKMGASELYAFLKPMPKGADLHMHLSGAVYAETFIAEAARQGLCVVPVDSSDPPAVLAPPDALKFGPPVTGKSAPCGADGVRASVALKDQPLYDELIDSFSMRGFVPTPGITGHDQFFATFGRFGGLKNDYGEWLDQVAGRAAAQNEQYLEIMSTPTFSHAASLGYKLGWPAGTDKEISSAELARLRDALLAAGLRDEVAPDIQEFTATENAREQLEHCDAADPASLETPAAQEAPAAIVALGDHAACGVKVRWLYQVLRGFPPQQVFAQTLLGFEVASADPDVVGLNFVMAEDGRVSMQDYHLQMQMLDYLHSVYPKVHITLHAGELAPGMVPPQGLTFHIREAVELGHAERIGHGVDVLHEDHPYQLLKEMAGRHIMVEVNLTSNDVILGIKGTNHPLGAYLAAHVPVALSTDDEGVSRIDLTHEFVKGAEEQGLTYIELKQMARTSLEHAFLPGESLWAAPDNFARRKSACAAPIAATSNPSTACAALLHSSERAAEQWELERRFASFEAAQH